MMNGVRRFARSEMGASLLEYGLLLALIAAICIAIVESVGTKTSKGFKNMDSAW